jgi:RimJ/RimL family protein N-acetyltransferase
MAVMDADSNRDPAVDGVPDLTLSVDELILRPWLAADSPAVWAICQDPEIARWVTIPQPFQTADAVAFVEGARALWRAGTGAPFAITDGATGQVLGAVTRFGPDGHQATLGLWLAPAARGRGVGTRALRLVTDWTFATTSVIRIDTFIMVGNERSERMVVRAGFVREGILRAWDVQSNGRPVDCVAYARLRDDP